MKEKLSKLSKREKFLIIILLVVGVGYLVIFQLIIPAVNQMMASSTQHDDLVFQQQQMELAFAGEPLDQSENDKARKTLATDQAFFSDDMTDYEIDQYITNLCYSCGFAPAVLSIQEIADVGPDEDTGVPGDITQENPAETAAAAQGPASAEEAAEPAPEPVPYTAPVRQATVSVQGMGNTDNLEQLLAKVSKTSFLTTQTVKYSSDSQQIDVVFILYMNNPALDVA